MATQKRMKANELVLLLAKLVDMDVEMMARIANLPVRNLRSWLAGKRENLRLQSVMNLMSVMGLKADGGLRLDDSRVHYWYIEDTIFSQKKRVYASITQLSKLLTGCSITAVAPTTLKLKERLGYSFYLVASAKVRLVICVKRSLFRRPDISPEVIKGASWRDDSDDHSITANSRLWTHLVERDLTTFEFDRMFNLVDESTSWADVSLMAREFGVTAADVAQWILERSGEAPVASHPADDDGGIDIEDGARLYLVAG
ncbi:hypothetical protein [Pseudomonas sp. WS 5532]|uniref:hypothetical protein n=1 Tax=Pseudomonas sp. WS 5532 TaxID=2717495 RepID=UPI0021CD11E4|nr:hypothetical protein [Pseudomonas sp. WS 5532]